MPEPAPSTQKGQLDALFTALNVTDFNAAIAAIGNYSAAGQWQGERAALFALLGVPPTADQATAINAITSLKTAKPKSEEDEDEDKKDDDDKAALFAILGATDHAGAMANATAWKAGAVNFATLLAVIGAADMNAAIVSVATMKGANDNHAALVKALGATDHTTALAKATDVKGTVATEVKRVAASAGLGAPIDKGAAAGSKAEGGGEKVTNLTPRKRLAAFTNAQLNRTGGQPAS